MALFDHDLLDARSRRLPPVPDGRRLRVAVIGGGIAGMSAAWLLSGRHDVTVFEREGQLGGHSNTVEVSGPTGPVAVDTGFIVYNEVNYPNLTALFRHLGVATQASDMSFAASLDDGRFEYAGSDLDGLFGQRRNLVRPRFWRMLRDLLRFYREAPATLDDPGSVALTLGAYLDREGYGEPFIRDHLLPMAAAVWSTPALRMRDYPLAAFVRFCDTHGLLRLTERPQWRTVTGGSRRYVEELTAAYRDNVRGATPAVRLVREAGGVVVVDPSGARQAFDHAVVAAHADDALALLDDPTVAERRLLGAFRYQPNETVLHSDAALMPRRRRVWSSWNYLARSDDNGQDAVGVTYWMNRLQNLDPALPLFVSLNPAVEPAPATVHARMTYTHPMSDAASAAAQKDLWSLQGDRRTWFCGSYFGAGFHEDALQSGLAVAEVLGGVRRPWRVEDESGRIHLPPHVRPREVLA